MKGIKGDLQEVSSKRYISQVQKLWGTFRSIYSGSAEELPKWEQGIVLQFLCEMPDEIKKLLGEVHWGHKGDKSLSTSTQRNYYNSILGFMRGSPIIPVGFIDDYKEAIKFYTEERDKLGEILSEHIASHKKDEGEESNWITLEEYDAVIEKIEKENDDSNRWLKDYSCLFDDSELPPRKKSGLITDLLGVQNEILLYLYRHQPPARNDYAGMEITTAKEMRKKENIELGENRLVIRAKGAWNFHFGEYKTKKNHGITRVDVNKKVQKKLRKWLDLNKSRFLLLNRDLKPLSRNNLTKRLTGIFQKELGKSVGSCMMRHIFVSQNAEKIKEIESNAEAMMHSVPQNIKYVKYNAL